MQTDLQTIQVLGTKFNVNEYNSENSTTTLVEGKVKVEADNQNNKILLPGQQSITNDRQIVAKDVEVSDYIAWKNGEFVFNDESLPIVMEKIKRWYDLDIVVEASAQDIYLWGSIQRKENFAQVLKLIKQTNRNLKINIDGRKVTVSR